MQRNYDHTFCLLLNNSPNVNTGSVTSYSCQENTCNTYRTVHVNTLPHESFAISGLNTADISLPLFDGNSEVNPVFHLKRQDEFLKLQGVPQMYHLTVACRSTVGKLSWQWLEAISDKLTDYEAFKIAFLNT